MTRSGLPWFRMYAEFAMDPVVQSLSFDDQRHFVMLMCLKCSGTLDRDVPDSVRESIILRALGIHGTAAIEAKARLVAIGLIDESWQPRKWAERQFESDSSTERVRSFRERKQVKRFRNVSETAQETDTDTEEASRLSAGVVASRNDTQQSPESSPETATTQGDDNAHSGVPRNPCPAERIVDLYHAKLPMARRVEQLTPTRRAALRARWHNELPTLDAFGNYFDDVAASRFLTGRVNGHGDRKPFVADFDWLLKPSNLVKVLEGKYHDG